MTDERITYEPRTENGKHYVIAIAKLDRINPQKADGRDRLGAAEALCSLLIDLCDVLFEDEQKAIERVKRLEAVAEAARDCGLSFSSETSLLTIEFDEAAVERLSAALAALEEGVPPVGTESLEENPSEEAPCVSHTFDRPPRLLS